MTLVQKTLASLICVGALAGCSCNDRPYHQTSLQRLVDNQKTFKRIAVEGVPSLVKSDGFILSSGTNAMYVERAICVGLLSGSFEAAGSALDWQSKGTNAKTVRVYGDYDGDKTIHARFLEINGNLYPVYKSTH